MPVQMVKAHNAVVEDRGMVSIERGPLVYCAEWPDNEADVRTYLLNPNANFSVSPSTLTTESGKQYPIVTVSTTDVQTLSYDSRHNLQVKGGKLTLIPYYAWDHRGQKGGMEVWIPVDVQAASATPRLANSLGDNGFFNR